MQTSLALDRMNTRYCLITDDCGITRCGLNQLMALLKAVLNCRGDMKALNIVSIIVSGIFVLVSALLLGSMIQAEIVVNKCKTIGVFIERNVIYECKPKQDGDL
jgi:hypothetical protein